MLLGGLLIIYRSKNKKIYIIREGNTRHESDPTEDKESILPLSEYQPSHQCHSDLRIATTPIQQLYLDSH